MSDFQQPNLTQIEMCVMNHPRQRSSKSSKPCGDPDCIVRWFHILDVIQNHARLKGENAQLREQITDSPLRAPPMSEQLHTCSYHCDRPGCVRAQRDQLREWMESVTMPLTPEREAKLAERDVRCREMVEWLRDHSRACSSFTDDIADELERLIDKVPFLERYIAKQEAEDEA